MDYAIEFESATVPISRLRELAEEAFPHTGRLVAYGYDGNDPGGTRNWMAYDKQLKSQNGIIVFVEQGQPEPPEVANMEKIGTGTFAIGETDIRRVTVYYSAGN